MSRKIRIAAAFILTVLGMAASAGVSHAADDPFGGAAPVAAETLQSERGGFTADGVTFGFGAVLQTLVNGQVALTTTLTLLDSGAVSKQVVVNDALLANDTPGGGAGVPTVIPVNSAASIAAALAGTNINETGLSGTGLVIKSDTGVTAVLDSVTPNQLQNLVINTASGQNIAQSTAITLSLPADELAGFQASTLMNGLNNALAFSQTGH